ncbi:MAG TPA: GAF domain-containing protein [Anaerolineales bacterium]|nr:GAF domain-containing protein [Anaerolineales bacterium]
MAVVLFVSVLVMILLRRLPRNSLVAQNSSSTLIFPQATNSNESVLIVQPGGRIEYINDLGREWFGLRPDEPSDLERLIRRARPAEDLLNLCVHPGQKRLSIGGRLVEASSYQVPGPYPLMLITMRAVELSADLSNVGTDSSILKIVSDLGKNVSASLDLEDTLYAILLNVSHLVPADLMEIKVWDASKQVLIPYMLEASGTARAVQAAHSQFGGLTNALSFRQKSLLIPDTRVPDPSLPEWNGSSPVKSYLGLPLLADNQMVGTLEIGHLSPGVLGQHDLDLVQLISTQAAYAVRNSILYASEKSRSAELSGLANLAQAFSVAQDYTNLISRLIKTITPLFSVEILGFLLYDESKLTLEGQIPFQGLPKHIVEIFRTTIQPESPAEKLLLARKLLVTRDAATDPNWRQLGLQDLAQAASLRESILVPLVSGERFVGFLQFSNHSEVGLEFSEAEIRLAKTVADQAAGIIDNSFIVEKINQRALRSDALHRLASFVSSPSTLDDILRFSVRELA